MDTATRERTAKGIFERMSPEERRSTLVLSPAYRSEYNRLLDSEDRMTLPRYFWRRWLPVLGAEAASLYVVLRDMARVEAARSDAWCWPEQHELARRLGVSKNTRRKSLSLLEVNGFIRTTRRRERPVGEWRLVQATNSYEVFLDIPLTERDAVELLAREMAEQVTDAGGPGRSPEAERSFYASLSPNSALSATEFKNCTQWGERNQAVGSTEFKICAPNVSNVDNISNVRDTSRKQGTLREHPAVKRMTASERRDRATLAAEIGETLQRMSGDRSGEAHRSSGFHRRVAFLLPQTLVRMAIRATRDAVENRTSGRGGVRGDPGAFFGGIVKQLARDHGIDLGLKHSGKAPPRRAGIELPPKHGAASRGIARPPAEPRIATPPELSARVSPEEAKRHLAEMLAVLARVKAP